MSKPNSKSAARRAVAALESELGALQTAQMREGVTDVRYARIQELRSLIWAKREVAGLNGAAHAVDSLFR